MKIHSWNSSILGLRCFGDKKEIKGVDGMSVIQTRSEGIAYGIRMTFSLFERSIHMTFSWFGNI